MTETATQPEELYPTIPKQSVRERVLRAARSAEEARWEVVNERRIGGEKLYHSWATCSAGWLMEREAVLGAYVSDWAYLFGGLDACHAAVAAERARVRADLDAKLAEEGTDA